MRIKRAGQPLSRSAACALLVLAAVLFFLSASLAASDLRLEGVMFDDADPSASLALINGQAVRAGQVVDGQKILRVERNCVFTAPEAGGAEVRLDVTEAAAAQSAAPLPEAPKPSWQEALKAWWEGTFPQKQNAPRGQAKADLWERIAVTDLMQIYQAGSTFASQKGQRPASLEQLVQTGSLPDRYAKGVYGKYKFSLISEEPEPGINADPVEPSLGLRHFFIDKNAAIHAEKDKPAGPQSPVYEASGESVSAS
ncbi:MAG TPA: hypothetical protein VL688_03340 [Verrucomicrobiae bacterium]|nr:hypothetical protein [Verrucomicrobiae bacterium]